MKELDYEQKKIELQKAQLKFEDSNINDSNAPSSSLVPRELVKSEAESHGMSEAQANHTLNRALPTYTTLRRKSETEITIETQR